MIVMADGDHSQFSSFLAEAWGNGSSDVDWCYSYDNCTFRYSPCESNQLHPDLRYNDASAAWVLIAAIIVFFMKAGFMLLEVSFARTVKERRNVVIIKHQDAFASAFGFFLLGFDVISRYGSPQNIQPRFFGVTDPVIWFFKFTFASNAATIVGGCLVTNKYKMRLPAAFISAFVISGIIHPVVARIIWSDDCQSLSPYRFCLYKGLSSHTCGYNCSSNMGFRERLYVLDFAGGGAVHLIGGVAGLMLCLFAKFRDWTDKKKEYDHHELGNVPHPGHTELAESGAEQPEDRDPQSFWEWMYPVHGGEETVSEAALGVIILWFCWFAFNCGSTESVELGRPLRSYTGTEEYPYYGIPSVIAINMILSVAAGGTMAVLIAVWAQIRYRAESVSANEIANGILSSLVAITAGCAFVDYWGACFIGLTAVLLYHFGCFLEYKLGIKDTARVVPVHGMCGLWSLLAVAVFQVPGTTADCNLHAAFEGLCYCNLRLPPLNYGERLGAQFLGAFIMLGIGVIGSSLMYGTLYIIPIKPFIWIFERVCFLNPANRTPLRYSGGWLLTSPDEEFTMQDLESGLRADPPTSDDNPTIQEEERFAIRGQGYGAMEPYRASQIASIHPGREPHVNGIPENAGGSPPHLYASDYKQDSPERRRHTVAGGRGAPKQVRAEVTGMPPSGTNTGDKSLTAGSTVTPKRPPTGVPSGMLEDS